MQESKQSDSAIFPNSRANNSRCSGSIYPIIELIRDLMGIYIVAKFGTNWCKQSQFQQFVQIQGQISQTVLVRLDP